MPEGRVTRLRDSVVCEECGCLVAEIKWDTHERWHEHLVRALKRARLGF